MGKEATKQRVKIDVRDEGGRIRSHIPLMRLVNIPEAPVLDRRPVTSKTGSIGRLLPFFGECRFQGDQMADRKPPLMVVGRQSRQFREREKGRQAA